MNKSDIDFLTNVITLEKDKAIEESQKELGYMNGFSNGVNYLYKKNAKDSIFHILQISIFFSIF